MFTPGGAAWRPVHSKSRTRRNVKAWELASRSEKGSPLLCLLLIMRFRKLPG